MIWCPPVPWIIKYVTWSVHWFPVTSSVSHCFISNVVLTREQNHGFAAVGNTTCAESGDSCGSHIFRILLHYSCLFQVELVSHFGSEHFCPLSLIRCVTFRPLRLFPTCSVIKPCVLVCSNHILLKTVQTAQWFSVSQVISVWPQVGVKSYYVMFGVCQAHLLPRCQAFGGN